VLYLVNVLTDLLASMPTKGEMRSIGHGAAAAARATNACTYLNLAIANAR
jgi:hypothetical protein